MLMKDCIELIVELGDIVIDMFVENVLVIFIIS